MLLTSRIRRVQVNTWVLLAVSIVWLAVNARWIVTYRRKQLLDIDEAGYIGMALNDSHAAARDGFLGWIQGVEAPSIQAPLTSALTSLHFMAIGPYVVTAFIVPMLAGLAVILMTYGLANRLAGRRVAWLALILVATAPGVLIESRSYHFGTPVTAVTVAALFFLVRSNGMAKVGSSVAFGVFLGLMPLTRTMSVAFVPALVLAGLVQALWSADRRRRLLNFGLSVLVAVGVGALWLVPNGERVYRYLTGFGYGTQSAEYGSESGLLNPSAWLFRFRILMNDQYLPHALLLCLGAVAAIYVTIRALRADRFRAFLGRAAGSPLLPMVALVVGGYASLISSPNAGQQFALPLFPAMVVIALWGLARVPWGATKALPALVTVVAVVAVVPALDLRLPTARPVAVDLPLLGGVKVTDGRAAIQSTEGLGLQSQATEPVDAEAARKWIEASDWAAKQIVANNALQGITAFGFRDRLFNTNTVQLAMLQDKGYGVAMAMINPTETGTSLPAYQSWLTQYHQSLNGDASTSCLLFTATGTLNEFTPVVDPPLMAAAASTSAFTPIATHDLPSGRQLTLWRRPQPACVPH